MNALTPPVRLGELHEDGIAPSVFVLLERGVGLRPAMARDTRGIVELRFAEGFAPVRIEFGEREIVVADVAPLEPPVHGPPPDLVVSGRLPDVIKLTTAPMVAGLPNPIDRRGRAALGQLARGRVQISGDRALGRRLLALLAI